MNPHNAMSTKCHLQLAIISRLLGRSNSNVIQSSTKKCIDYYESTVLFKGVVPKIVYLLDITRSGQFTLMLNTMNTLIPYTRIIHKNIEISLWSNTKIEIPNQTFICNPNVNSKENLWNVPTSWTGKAKKTAVWNEWNEYKKTTTW